MYLRKDLLGLREMSDSEILFILKTAEDMKTKISDNNARDDSLAKTSVVTLFYENSTRTKMSFFMAGEYLGAKINDLGVATSSVNKGESLVDTGKNLDYMGTDVMVIRHNLTGAAHLLAKNVKASVINAGDGSNEHPTQALLDLYTIWEHKKNFKNLKVTIIGDITHSRVARSNVFGLVGLGAEVTLAGPPTLITGAFARLGAGCTADIKSAVRGADVIMGLRVQMERQKAAVFPDLREYTKFFGVGAETLKYAKDDALIMHPGPVNRGVEMEQCVVDHARSVILEQAQNGVAVRMAILKILSDNNRRMKGEAR